MSDLAGIYEAVVQNLDDPSGMGRARLKVPTVLGGAMSAWARPVLETGAAGGVSVGDRAWVLFEHGDINRPTWISPRHTHLDKADVSHVHDDRYYTETETNNLLVGKSNTGHTHGVSDLTATGTRDSSTFLRGDNVWAAPAGGGGSGGGVTTATTGLDLNVANAAPASPSLYDLWVDADETAAGTSGQGTFAARPAFGAQGRFYYATDNDTIYYDTGAAWIIWRDNPAWQAFAPTWDALTIGNANQGARYVQIGKTVHVNYNLSFGSTTVVTGNFRPQLPVPAQNAAVNAGSIWAFRNATTQWAIGTFVPAAYMVIVSPTGVSGLATATAPWTWAVSDAIRINLTYEAA